MTKLLSSNLHNSEVVAIGLRAGAIATVVNVAMLAAADKFGLTTARGGLLKLMLTPLFALSHKTGNNAILSRALEFASTYNFQIFFHCAVGLIMGLLLVKLAAGHLKKHPWSTALTAALIVWLINATIILPLLGEGLAGTQTIGSVGIAYFAIAHTTFFVILSLSTKRQMLRRG